MSAQEDWGRWLPNGKGQWVLQLPDECRNGHRLGPKVTHLSWVGCLCRRDGGQNGHQIVTCMICKDQRLVPACRNEADPPRIERDSTGFGDR